MKNFQIYAKNPLQTRLLNDGVAEVKDTHSDEDMERLRFELETFVCDGQYQEGLRKILRSFLDNVGRTDQPVAWVSGFYGSGKSHLVKMLRALWEDTKFADGSTARGIAKLPEEIKDLLKELTTAGKRCGGLRAFSGTLNAAAGDYIRTAILKILFATADLPTDIHAADFTFWLRREGLLDQVRDHVAKAGKDWKVEFTKLRVSSVVASALLQVKPDLAKNEADLRQLLKADFPERADVDNSEMNRLLREALGGGKDVPCTLIVLDEIQQYINESAERSIRVQEVAEELCKRYGGRVMLVGTGQAALASTSQLSRLMGRFTVRVQLSDQDVESVIRQVILAKDPQQRPVVDSTLTKHSGEIDRHLVGSQIAPTPVDREVWVADYPLLPTRRRFWERLLRALDTQGTYGQLRTQLKIIHDAVKENSIHELGTVVAGDYIYQALAPSLLQSSVLPKEIYDLVGSLRKEATPDSLLKARLVALTFLVEKLPKDGAYRAGVRATKETLADLLVEDLDGDNNTFRKTIPRLLDELARDGKLLQIGDEFRVQTQEGMAWEAEFKRRLADLLNNKQRLASERADVLQAKVREFLAIRPTQGTSKTPRGLSAHFGMERPKDTGDNVSVWIRNGWDEAESAVKAEIQKAGTDSSTIFIFIPGGHTDELNSALATWKAAEETIASRGTTNTPEAEQARSAMETRSRLGSGDVARIIGTLVEQGGVHMGGGQQLSGGLTLRETVEEQAIPAALQRMFTEFKDADDQRWEVALTRAKKGDGAALSALGHQGEPDKHPVCRAVLGAIKAGTKGREIRDLFSSAPKGWPKDAIDGAMYVLECCGIISAWLDGQPVRLADLDRAKLSQVELRKEVVTIAATHRVRLRKLFQEVGVSFKQGEEDKSIIPAIQALRDAARSAGGDAPAPAPPSLIAIDALAAKMGNEQFVALADEVDNLAKELKSWKATAHAVQQRLDGWERLRRLAAAGGDLPAAVQARTTMDAVSQQRGLLQDPDPVAPLLKDVAKALRDALVARKKEFDQSHADESARLVADATWQKLTDDQRAQLRAQHRLDEKPSLAVGTDEEVLASAEATSLGGWTTRTHALPGRFAAAREDAARMLEPKAVRVGLPGATIHDENELDAWLADVRQRVAEQLKKGPAIL
ncbi:BREX system P-loop protein BrxC [bacterium]|nr:BREX system P-loop protein BrxC [bacterium]